MVCLNNMRSVGIFILWMCAIFCCSFTFSCQSIKQENVILREKLKRLEETNAECRNEHANLRRKCDSLVRHCIVLSKEVSGRYTYAYIDSIEKEIDYLRNHLENCHKAYKNNLENTRECRHFLYHVPGNEAKRITYNGSSYDCYVVNPNNCEVRFFWKDEKTLKPIGSLLNLMKIIEANTNNTLVFATNAGMYTETQAPKGLFIQNSNEMRPIDLKKEEYGNFYLQPNGIFMIDTIGNPAIIVTDSFNSEIRHRTRHATQSGPMLVIEGVINPKFRVNSESLNIRSGVGIMPDGKIVFIISNRPVSFYDFASVFKDEFKCINALYLDGAISEMYLPEISRFDSGGKFGPIIGIIKKTSP